MKARPLKFDGVKSYAPCDPPEATHVELNCPGPFATRLLPVIVRGQRAGTPCWSWNGDTEKPTLKPSILTSTEYGEQRTKIVCHSWVNDGRIQFLGDCTHEFAGQTLDLLEVED